MILGWDIYDVEIVNYLCYGIMFLCAISLVVIILVALFDDIQR